jgi:hypothetical protein
MVREADSRQQTQQTKKETTPSPCNFVVAFDFR